MPNALAQTILLNMKNDTSSTKAGLICLLEASVLLDPEKTVGALSDLQMQKVAEQIVQAMYAKGGN